MILDILDKAVIVIEIVIAFGLVILFHEFGHFIVAKINGVAVPEFAIGMGPEIIGIDWRGTRYKLCVFPIGGYVRMVGEDDDEDLEAKVPPEKNFRNKKPLQKISIIFAGPFMNYILAILLFAGIFIVWGVPREPDVPLESFSKYVTLDFVYPRKPAARAGLKDNDTVMSVNGQKPSSIKEFAALIHKSAGKSVTIKVKRDAEIKNINVVPVVPNWNKKKAIPKWDEEKVETWGKIGVVLGYPIPRKIKSITSGSPAAIAGLKEGDIILDFDKNTFLGTSYTLHSEKLNLSVLQKDGAPKTVTITGKQGAPLGANLVSLYRRLGLFSAISAGSDRCVMIIKLTFFFLYEMIQRKVSTDEIAGPVGIMQIASKFARKGFYDFVNFFGIISISIAIINLFPIPALDGSRIIFHTWEAIIRRPLDPKREALIHYVGFCFLIALMLLITYKDIRSLLGI